MTTVGTACASSESHYDPRWAESWDAVGLAVGDPCRGAVVFAVDPTPESFAAEAVAAGAQLLVTHHPLFLHHTHATTPGGRVVHTLVGGGCALFTAHTNANVARPGVSDALAAALGVVDTEPLSMSAELCRGPGQADRLRPRGRPCAGARSPRAAAPGASVTTSGARGGRPGRARSGRSPVPIRRSRRDAIEEVSEDPPRTRRPRSRRSAVIAALRSAHSVTRSRPSTSSPVVDRRPERGRMQRTLTEPTTSGPALFSHRGRLAPNRRRSAGGR